MMVFQVVYKYMSASISVAAETGVVAIGPIANLCVFLSFVALGHMFHKVSELVVVVWGMIGLRCDASCSLICSLNGIDKRRTHSLRLCL